MGALNFLHLALVSTLLLVHVTHVTHHRRGEVGSQYARFIPPLRVVESRWVPQPGVRSSNESTFYVSDWAACPLSAGEPGFQRKCNVKGPCDALPEGVHAYDDLPRTTATGERVQDAIQRALRAAWGPQPPQIDLYLRAGCGAVTELAFLLPTIELFWPESLGEVIIALDKGNNATLEAFLLRDWRTTRQSYRFVYEELPCMTSSLMNQLSYLNLDLHSRAQYIVTLDSDCALHSPVTPDLLFDARGRLLLPHSAVYQPYYWYLSVEHFFVLGSYTSHSMITQPVSFARETFVAYREWITNSHSECFFDSVTRYLDLVLPPRRVYMGAYCWMCQLLTFLQLDEHAADAYALIDVDDVRNTYQRFAIHTTYDRTNGTLKDETYEEKSRLAVLQGLCRVLGEVLLPECAGVGRAFVDEVTFVYAAGLRFGNPSINARRLDHYITAFRAAAGL